MLQPIHMNRIRNGTANTICPSPDDIEILICPRAEFQSMLFLSQPRDFRLMTGSLPRVPYRHNHGTDRYQSGCPRCAIRSEEHTSELQSLMSISYAVFCLKKQKNTTAT